MVCCCVQDLRADQGLECLCGKYSGEARGVICAKWRIECFTLSKVRRERGDGQSARSPFAHIWFPEVAAEPDGYGGSPLRAAISSACCISRPMCRQTRDLLRSIAALITGTISSAKTEES